MKKFYVLIFLLVSGFTFAQVNYVIKIKNLTYRINEGVKNRTSSNIRITVHYQNGTSANAYARDIDNEGDNENNITLANVNSSSKPVSIECYAFVNFRTGTDANSSKYANVNTYCPSGSFNQSYSPRMTPITFNYTIEAKINVTPPGADNILPTHTKKTIVASSGYDAAYYKWQYTLIPNATATQWTDLPQYNNSPSITVDAIDILGANAGLNIGKDIYFRIKPCTVTPGLSGIATYSIRLSAPQVNSLTRTQPKCTDTDDGSVQLVFNRTLLNGEQLNYTLFDEIAQTPANYNGILAIDANKTFSISGLRAGTYTLQLIGFKDGLNTSIGNPLDPNLFALKTFEITAPTPLDFTLNSTDVQCYGSQDGTITINPVGGTRTLPGNDYYSLDNGATWIPFPNDKPHTITGLGPGTYYVKVKDMNECIAKIQTLVNGEIKLENDKVLEKTISEPLLPLTLNYTFKKNPTFYGAANGKIVAAISGGTINDDKSYEYEWKNSSGIALPATGEYNSADKTYNITLDNVPEGEYKLTVKDKNYNNAANKAGCSVIESSQTLTQPAKIEITITETQAISCNSENLDSDKDKFSDGIFTATVVGGIQFTGSANNGLPYKYTWSKYNTQTNLWEELTEEKTASIGNISQGNYSLNVEDANGIVQGTYNTTDLVTAIPTTKEIVEPTKLELLFTSGNVSCHQGNNGWATATVSGGAGSYKYTWYNTGDGIIDENKIAQLTAGEYTVEITDSKGCFIKGSIVISEPDEIVKIEYEEIFTPTFSGATNGRIVARITGGTPYDPIANNGKLYEYEWKNATGVLQTTTAEVKNGIYTITLNGVPADDYFLTVKDKNYSEATNQIINCSVLESKVTLNEPDPLKVVFEIVRTISCNTSNEFGNATDTTPNDGQRDESQDGILTAHVSGGTPLASSVNNGLPYYFYWKKQQADGSWTALPNITGETASNLSHGNYALNVKDRNGIMLGTYVNNTLTQEIDVTQLMQEPPKLTVTITHGNVFCNGGNDGWATANVSGGTAPYQYKWSNEVESNENTILKAGTYTVYVTDFRECTTQASVVISEPVAPLAIKYTEVLNPSFYKATNGKIVVEVTGGTILPDNSYWFEWKNSKGIIQTTTTTNFNNGIYTISLNGLPEEIYSLTVRDANYDPATYKTSCIVANSVTVLDDPDPLEINFEVVRTISCNVSNEFGNETDATPQDNQRDESQDGILVAHVKGGIQLKPDQNNGLPYFFTWKKQQKDGSWLLWNDHDETAENLSDGTYALNIEDANGIKLGSYVNNILVKETPVTQFMPEPAKLTLTFTKLNASCNNGEDGWAEAHVTGGTAPYTYEWTNGGTTEKIENITTNNYFVFVTDAKGCVVQGSIFVGDPKGIFTRETVKNSTCYKGNDGSIQLNVTGGNLPYTYLWNTGSTTKDLNNLTAGDYEVAITCPDCCVYKKKFVLKDPEPVIVNIGPDRTLCNDQNLDLDATVTDPKAQYSWTSTNGFTSNEPKVNLSKAGTYHVKVTSDLGCIGEDEIVLKTSQAVISSEFLLSSQAYLDEEVILINTSNPFGESTNWVIPKGVKVVEQKEKYITLKFDAAGVYSIGLQQTQGECYATYSKNITVEQRSTLPNAGTTSQFIVDFIVTPNPSTGNFKAHVTLENPGDINLRLFSTTGQNTMIQKKESGKKKYEIDFETTLESGMYVLVLETGQQTLVKKIIIY